VTAVTAFGRDLAARIALGGALLLSACQHDSGISFDDSVLTTPDAGGSTNTGGSDADAGAGGQGASSSGGSMADAGGSAGGTASAGAAGHAAGGGGSGGKPMGMGGGSAGADAGGAAGKAGQGGAAAGGSMAGMGGAKNPGPMTIVITDIADTDVSSCLTNANHGEEKTINVDGDDDFCVVESLINAPLLQVPAGAVITEATLTLNCLNVGDPATVSFANEPWAEDSVRWYNRPSVGAKLGTVSCDMLGKVTIDLKAAVKAWLANDHEPYGIYLRMETSDGIDFSTSEADKEADRPTLTVTYNPPPK
jgi:hypothetical protein